MRGQAIWGLSPYRRADDITENGHAIANKRVLIDTGPGGTPDGMRCDADGNLWCGWGMGSEALDGMLAFAPDRTKIGRIALPERCANVCFGGRQRNRLFMAASQLLYALYVNSQGVPGGQRAEAGSRVLKTEVPRRLNLPPVRDKVHFRE
jgi:gluconolactonase